MNPLRHLLRETVVPIVAVSPIVAGEAIKGPAADMFRAFGVTPSATAVAARYADFLDGFILDEQDAHEQSAIEALGLKVAVTDTLMTDAGARNGWHRLRSISLPHYNPLNVHVAHLKPRLCPSFLKTSVLSLFNFSPHVPFTRKGLGINPCQTLWLAKQRLASVLSEEERTHFTHWLLTTLLATVHASAGNLHPILLTSDPSLVALATPYGYSTLPDPPNADLNAVLEHGRAYAIEQGAESLLILPTDIPYLTPAALSAFIAYTEGTTPCVLIAPDREGIGTNALLVRPATAIPFRFGIDSAARHRAEAQKSGIPFLEYRDPAFAQVYMPTIIGS